MRVRRPGSWAPVAMAIATQAATVATHELAEASTADGEVTAVACGGSAAGSALGPGANGPGVPGPEPRAGSAASAGSRVRRGRL